jgi:DNA/RNA endonuclease YhcR with UshA esterase domain
MLNEILPAPRNHDWDGDGTANADDEWVELVNTGDQSLDISGWRLWGGQIGDDGLPTGWYYQLPPGSTIDPHGFQVIFHKDSDIRLPNNGGAIHWLMPVPDGWQIADSFSWNHFPGSDRSFSRYPDGSGPWDVRAVTPGRANQLLPTPPPPPPAPTATPAPSYGPPQPIANAYHAPAKSNITLIGAVTVAPGDFSNRIIYIQDDSGGIMVYLWRGDYPDLQPGDRVQVQGRLKDYRGQREVTLSNPGHITKLGTAPPPEPKFIRTGQVNDNQMGQLLLVAGRVQNVRKYSFELDDGSGPVRIEHPYKAQWQLPALQPGMTVSVTGVLARYKDTLHILPRSPQDISPPPGVLPTTGGKIDQVTATPLH